MANNEKNFCPLPWVSLCVQPYGPALCCSSYVDLRSHPDESPAEVFQNKTMTDIREKFLNNEWPSQCRTCQKNEERGVLSYREIVIRSGVYDDLMAKKEKLDGWGIIDRLKEKYLKLTRPITSRPFLIRYLELASSSYCNLKCRMCGPRYSSKWKEDIEPLIEAGFAEDMAPMSGFNDNSSKEIGATELVNLLDNNPNLMMKGGEPMLNKHNAEVIAKVVASGKIKETTLSITTNGIILADWFIRHLKDFKKVQITFSIDASGPLNQYIRAGNYKNEDLKINMDKIKNIRSDVVIVVSTAYQIYNMLNYPEIIKEYAAWADHFDITPAMNYQLNPQIVPDELRKLAMERVQKLLNREKIPSLKRTYQDIIDYLSIGKFNPHAWKRFLDFTDALDKIRSESLIEIEPELAPFLATDTTS